MHQLPLPLSDTPSSEKYFFPILFKYFDIQIFIISLWNMKMQSFLSICDDRNVCSHELMLPDGSTILPTSAFSKIWGGGGGGGGGGLTMLTGFPGTRWPWLRFSESYAARISMEISRMCEFRVIMGIMTVLLGCCSSSTLGSRANDYVKTLATLEF